MTPLRRFASITLRIIPFVLLLAAAAAGSAWWYLHPKVTETRGIVYGHRQGHDLTLAVVRPEHPSGIGILMMVSGGWKSDPSAFHPWEAAPLLRRGQTVIAVSHLSQPQASVMDIVADAQRAVRFIRHHAAEYGIDPHRLGVVGASSGGHLSLMLATTGGPGDPAAADEVDRDDSSVQAAAVFFPVTDMIDLGPSTENAHDHGPPIHFRQAFGPHGTDPAVWQHLGHDLSPIDHITAAMPPVSIIHGGADTLVPPDQSQRFQQRASEKGKKVELLIRPGKGHGWTTMMWDETLLAQWLDEQLGKKE